MTSRSDCVRGCLRPEVHLADRPASANPAEPCPIPRRCAAAVVLEGFVVCETCRKRIRGLLRIAPDLLGRLRALAGHGKAVVYSPVKTTALAFTAPDQVDAEVADALIEITQNLRDWSRWINMRTLDGVDRILGDADQTLRLAAAGLHLARRARRDGYAGRYSVFSGRCSAKAPAAFRAAPGTRGSASRSGTRPAA